MYDERTKRNVDGCRAGSNDYLRLQLITCGAGQHLTNEVPETRHLTLQSYLIKPVQRICKYPLLVRVRPACRTRDAMLVQ